MIYLVKISISNKLLIKRGLQLNVPPSQLVALAIKLHLVEGQL
jgi:hypothetical protein